MSGCHRVLISDGLRRTIEDIKEITGKHSDEDVYAMLKECNMDPNETAQKLLYLDTFHEVKKKRDRRKASVNNGAQKDYCQSTGMQQRGTRGDRESYSFDARGGRQVNTHHENSYSIGKERASKSSMPVLHKIEHNAVPGWTSFTAHTNSSATLSNGSSHHEWTCQLEEHSIRGAIKDSKVGDNNQSGQKKSLPTLMVKQLTAVNPGFTPTPTPTTTPTSSSTVAERAGFEGGSLKSKASHLENSASSPSVSGLYSSASDPVLVPSLNPRNPAAVGIIKRETGNQRNAAEISAAPLAKSRTTAAQTVTNGEASSGSVELTSNTQQIECQAVERSHLADPLLLPPSTDNSVAAAKSNQETLPVRQVNGLSKVMSSEATSVALEASIQSLPTGDGIGSKQETSEELHASTCQSVVFPNHLHVPEAFKNAVIFGSLDAHLGQNNDDSEPRVVSVPTNVGAAKEPFVAHQSSFSTSGQGDYPNHPQSPPRVPVILTPSSDIVSSGNALRFDQSRQEMLQPVGGSHNTLLPPAPGRGLTIAPAPSQRVPRKGLEPQGGNSLVPAIKGSTPSVTQPTGIVQSPVAMSPQFFPLLRQPYPPNYIPYSPYFSQLYMPPPNARQLLGHSGFPQQPSTGNIYVPSTAASASGVKFPLPSLYKPGNVVGNLTQFGIPSGYGSYETSGVGYSSTVALPPCTSTSNGDIVGSILKEKSIYSMIKQNEDLHAWNSASGRDLSANIFYNLPPGQPHVAYTTTQVRHNSFPGIYHPTQAIAPAVESMVPPLTSYPLPHLQPQLRHGQVNWEK